MFLVFTNLTIRRLGGVHLVDGDDQLLHAEGEREKGVLASLAVLGDPRLKLTRPSGDDKHGTVRLQQQSSHRLPTVLGNFLDG